MAEFKIDGRMKVKGLKEKFKDTFGLTLRVYTTVTCKSPAKDVATLASIRTEGAKGGEITVGAIVKSEVLRKWWQMPTVLVCR